MSQEHSPMEETRPAAGDEATTTFTKTTMPPAVMLAFVIIALLGVLIIISLRGGGGGSGAEDTDMAELQAEANALRTQLNRERVAMGLRPLEGNTESMDDIAERLKSDANAMAALAGSLQSMLAEKDTEITAKNAELIRSEQLRQTLAAESARLQGELQRSLVAGSETDLLRRDLTAMKAQRDALAAELATVRQELAGKSAGASADDFADLQRRFEETERARSFFEARVTELEAELSKARLFASSENELLPAAVELVRSLRKLEGKPDSEISTSYSSLGTDLGANVLHTLNFATGSSELNTADKEMIQKLVDEIPDGDLVLAIGYASETGNVDSNRVLSSDRATAAAQLFSEIKRPGQLVQAVYLGQTDRFSSRIPERNQLVEIWRIRKK
jgi:outer membrane protein OmpA-like peptidoglycan-associated protein